MQSLGLGRKDNPFLLPVQQLKNKTFPPPSDLVITDNLEA